MSDTLKGYTLRGGCDQGVVLDCDRCGAEVLRGTAAPLVAFVRAATEHSGRCLG